jgi:hypothetical protein
MKTLEALAQAVEDAWKTRIGTPFASPWNGDPKVEQAMEAWLAARRSAREPLSDRPADASLYTAMHGEPAAREGWVWVRSIQPDFKRAVLVSLDAIVALQKVDPGTGRYSVAACELLARDLDVLIRGK